MCNVVVVRPGATLFDEQERIKGSLDIPLSTQGLEQVQRAATQLEQLPISIVYSGPCESAQDTAREIAEHVRTKWKVCECFKNLDHGLWQGKTIEEVRRQQPKLFRQVQDNPRAFCPPGGETISEAEARVAKLLAKLCKKHANETIAVVIPEPLASVVSNRLTETDFRDMWEAEQDDGTWEVIDAEAHSCIDSGSHSPNHEDLVIKVPADSAEFAVPEARQERTGEASSDSSAGDPSQPDRTSSIQRYQEPELVS